MVMCCRRDITPYISVSLIANEKYSNRKVIVAFCPVCQAMIVELTQFNNVTGEFEITRPKRKHAVSFLKKLENQVIHQDKIPSGSKGNMGFVFGVNREYKSGKIFQYAVDFNGVKKLIKIIE